MSWNTLGGEVADSFRLCVLAGPFRGQLTAVCIPLCRNKKGKLIDCRGEKIKAGWNCLLQEVGKTDGNFFNCEWSVQSGQVFVFCLFLCLKKKGLAVACLSIISRLLIATIVSIFQTPTRITRHDLSVHVFTMITRRRCSGEPPAMEKENIHYIRD